MKKPRTKANDLLGVALIRSPGAPSLRLLNCSDEWDAVVMAEAQLLSRWTGTTPQLYHTDRGTAADPSGNILIKRAQLESLFGSFTGEKYKTAIFFALAHEFGHLCQFKHFGVKVTLDRPRVQIEAHADMLAGAWLGLRLAQGQQRFSPDVVEAGLQLKSSTAAYPTPYQRSRLVQNAMGLSVMLAHIAEPQVQDGSYTKLEAGLKRTDVEDLFEIASRQLGEIPPTAPPSSGRRGWRRAGR